MGTAAALVDQNELSSLRIEQSQLIALLKNKADSWRTKLIRLAEIFERRYELADPEFDNDNFSVSRISTEITHLLRRHNVAIADHVSDYLPEKYKNPNLARDWEEKRPVSWGGIDPTMLIDELSHLPAEEIKKLPSSIKIMLYDTIMKNKNLIESDALEQHYQLNDKQQRDPIRTSKPFAPRITKLGNAYIYLGETFIDFGNWVNNDFPPPPELDEKWITGPTTVASMFRNVMNVKYSLTDIQWLQRDHYRIHQSKHGAAVKDKVETLLCKKCTNLDSEKYNPDDFVEMEYDRDSSTNWRCPECRGTEGVKRGLTREQCGDKAIQSCPKCGLNFKWDQGLSPIETRAIELGNGLQFWNDAQDYYMAIAQKCIGVRKTKLGKDLSDKA